IELGTSAAFFAFGVFRLLKKALQHHSRGDDHQRPGACDEPPIVCPVIQRFEFRAEAGSKTSPSVSRAFSQSFRKPSRPRSVSGCLKSCSNTLYGMVPMCAPM